MKNRINAILIVANIIAWNVMVYERGRLAGVREANAIFSGARP